MCMRDPQNVPYILANHHPLLMHGHLILNGADLYRFQE